MTAIRDVGRRAFPIFALGVDLSVRMLERARAAAPAAGVTNVDAFAFTANVRDHQGTDRGTPLAGRF